MCEKRGPPLIALINITLLCASWAQSQGPTLERLAEEGSWEVWESGQRHWGRMPSASGNRGGEN